MTSFTATTARAALAALVVAVIAALGLTGVAVAQYVLPVVNAQGKVSPTKGGSKRKPRHASVTVGFTVSRESTSTVGRMELRLPRHIRLSARGFRSCPAERINDRGESSCPRRSRIGSGAATALIGPDRIPATWTAHLYAAGAREVAISLKGLTPIALRGALERAPSPNGQRIVVDMPPAMQQTPAGYVHLTAFKLRVGPATGVVRKKRRKGRKGRRKVRTSYVALRGCPRDREHDYAVHLTFADNPSPPLLRDVQAPDTSSCRRR